MKVSLKISYPEWTTAKVETVSSEVEAFGKDVLALVRKLEAEARGVDQEKEIAISGHIYA